MAGIVVQIAEALIVEQQLSFTLAGLCQASGAESVQVHRLVDVGLLQPSGAAPPEWQFDGSALPQTRRALRLAAAFELDLPAVCLVMDLLAEIDRLRAQLREP